LISEITEDIDVHGPGLSGIGGKTPTEFTAERKARVEEFTICFPYVGVGGVYSFQLLRGEAACSLGTFALEGAGVKVAVTRIFDEAVFHTVVAVAFAKDCVEGASVFRATARVVVTGARSSTDACARRRGRSGCKRVRRR
jgi:hypothetical protein